MVDLIDSSDDEGIRGRSLALLYQTYLTTDIDDHLTRSSLLVYTYTPRWLLLGCLEVLHSRSLLPARSSSLMRRRGLPGGVDLTQHYFHTMRAAQIHSRCTNCVHVNDYRRRSCARETSLALRCGASRRISLRCCGLFGCSQLSFSLVNPLQEECESSISCLLE